MPSSDTHQPMEAKLKVLLCGPQGQGKTRVANLLGGIATQGVYDPTAGVRIIELERPLTVREPKSRREIQIVASIELWDMSGDLQYENAWPACQKDVHGIIVVAEALQMQLEQSAPEKQVDFWFQAFSARVGLEATQAFVMVLANDEVTNTTAVLSAGKSKLGKLPPGVLSIQSHFGSSDLIEKEFDAFIGRIYYKAVSA